MKSKPQSINSHRTSEVQVQIHTSDNSGEGVNMKHCPGDSFQPWEGRPQGTNQEADFSVFNGLNHPQTRKWVSPSGVSIFISLACVKETKMEKFVPLEIIRTIIPNQKEGRRLPDPAEQISTEVRSAEQVFKTWELLCSYERHNN